MKRISDSEEWCSDCLLNRIYVTSSENYGSFRQAFSKQGKYTISYENLEKDGIEGVYLEKLPNIGDVAEALGLSSSGRDIQRGGFIVDGDLSEIDFDERLNLMLPYIGNGNPTSLVVFPDIMSLDAEAIRSELSEGYILEDLISFNCEGDDCNLSFYKETEDGRAITWLDVPVVSELGILVFDGGLTEELFFGTSAEVTALMQVRDEIGGLSRDEAISRLMELQNSISSGSFEVFGLEVRHASIRWFSPILLFTLQLLLLLQCRSLIALKPNLRDVHLQFVAPLLPSFSGLTISVIALILLPVVATLSLFASFQGLIFEVGDLETVPVLLSLSIAILGIINVYFSRIISGIDE